LPYHIVSLRLLDLFESAAHRAIVNAQKRCNLMEPVSMIVCLGYRSISAFANIRPSDGLAALNSASGIFRILIESCVLLDKCVAPK